MKKGYTVAVALLILGQVIFAQGNFKVHLTTFQQKVPAGYFDAIGKVSIQRDQNGFYQVFLGSYDTRQSEWILPGFSGEL
jgi:hypothetical protein